MYSLPSPGPTLGSPENPLDSDSASVNTSGEDEDVIPCVVSPARRRRRSSPRKMRRSSHSQPRPAFAFGRGYANAISRPRQDNGSQQLRQPPTHRARQNNSRSNQDLSLVVGTGKFQGLRAAKTVKTLPSQSRDPAGVFVTTPQGHYPPDAGTPHTFIMWPVTACNPHTVAQRRLQVLSHTGT